MPLGMACRSRFTMCSCLLFVYFLLFIGSTFLLPTATFSIVAYEEKMGGRGRGGGSADFSS